MSGRGRQKARKGNPGLLPSADPVGFQAWVKTGGVPPPSARRAPDSNGDPGEVRDAEEEPGEALQHADPVFPQLGVVLGHDLDALKEELGAKNLGLADEKEIGSLFKDCELGAEPPFGNFYDIETIIDKRLEKDDHIAFQGGTHDKTIHMSMKEYRKLVGPRVLAFSYRGR